jgi:hypothetical protein
MALSNVDLAADVVPGAPGKYEAYVDLVPGEWIKLKIDVHRVWAW